MAANARWVYATPGAMAFKLLTQAEKRRRKANLRHLVTLVQAVVKFPDSRTRVLPNLLIDSVVNLPVALPQNRRYTTFDNISVPLRLSTYQYLLGGTLSTNLFVIMGGAVSSFLVRSHFTQQNIIDCT